MREAEPHPTFWFSQLFHTLETPETEVNSQQEDEQAKALVSNEQ
jgi:hypothetical protein